MFCEPSARSQTRPVQQRGQVVRVRVADVDGDGVAAVLGEDRRQARGRSPRTPRPSSPRRSSPSRLHQRRAQPVGSSCSCLSAERLGADEAVAEARRRSSPRTETTSLALQSRPRARRWLRRRGRCGSAAPCAQVTPAARSIQSACEAHSSAPGGVEQRAGAVALAAVHVERPRHQRVRARRPRTGRAQPRGQAGEHHRRALAEVRHRRAGRAVERRPDALRAHVAGAVAERLVGRPVGGEHAVAQLAGEHAQPVARGRAPGPQTTQVGKGWRSHQCSRPACRRRRRLRRGDRVGHVEQQLVRPRPRPRARRRRAARPARRRAPRRAGARAAAARAARPGAPRRRPGRPRGRRCSRRSPSPAGR